MLQYELEDFRDGMGEFLESFCSRAMDAGDEGLTRIVLAECFCCWMDRADGTEMEL